MVDVSSSQQVSSRPALSLHKQLCSGRDSGASLSPPRMRGWWRRPLSVPVETVTRPATHKLSGLGVCALCLARVFATTHQHRSSPDSILAGRAALDSPFPLGVWCCGSYVRVVLPRPALLCCSSCWSCGGNIKADKLKHEDHADRVFLCGCT